MHIHLAVFLFGMAGLFGKFLSLSPGLIVIGRTFFASVALVLANLCSGQTFRFHSRAHAGVFIFLGGVLAVHWTTFFHSIQVSTVAVGLLTFSTFPVFVTFMEPFFFDEKLRFFDILTAVLVFLGLVLVIPSWDLGNQITQGAFWGTISGLTFALLSILNRKYVTIYASSVVAFYQNAFALLILLVFLSKDVPFVGLRELLFLGFLGVFCTALSHGLFIKGLRYVRAQLAGLIASLEPVYGILFALILLEEVPALRTVLGGAVILGTVTIASMKPGDE
jgi:drug/metabolite transporter (DMT)-like permease